jgi:hypothetical protein
MPASRGKAQPVNLQQLQNDGLVLAQHFAGGDAEQQGVTDLTGGAGDGDTNGLLAHDETPEMGESQVLSVPGCTSVRNQQPVLRKQRGSVPLISKPGQFVLCLI